MYSHIRITILFVLIFSTSFSQAETSEYLHCSNLGLFFGDCRLDEKTLVSKSNTERNFTIRYFFTCEGHALDIGLITENGFYPIIASKNQQSTETYGRSLTLVDRNPQGTLKSTFNSDCKLEIIDVKSSLSTSSLNTLQLFKEEVSLILTSVDSLSMVSELTNSILNQVQSANFENLSWQRDQMREIIRQLDLSALPSRKRIAFDSLLRTLDEMICNSKVTLPSSLNEKVQQLASEVYRAASTQLKELLNRASELRLRTTEILFEAEQPESDWQELFTLFDSVRANVESRTKSARDS